MRMRALQRNMTCPNCKTELEQLVCSETPGLSFGQFTIWGESAGADYDYDQKSRMHFPKTYYRNKIEPLWLCKCKVCQATRRDMKSLRGHVIGEHNMHMCALCLEHRQLFPSEFCVYTQADYDKHLRIGDKDGGEGHPYCEFCKKRYFDKTALFLHLVKDHYSCHICTKLGIQYRYYADYTTLEAHFRSDHFLCEDPACLEKRFVVFGNSIDLMGHQFQWHPGSQVSLLYNFSLSLVMFTFCFVLYSKAELFPRILSMVVLLIRRLRF
jgi:hypothetical protein